MAFYFSSKKSGNKLARHKIETLLQHIHVTVTGDNVVTHAIKDKRINDFEDGIEYYSGTWVGLQLHYNRKYKGFSFLEN